ncbi:MAG: hypothetical protein IPL28_27855 [Chloroflexi bacterium]|nr:hypothetical protein [Chloroflexota bacterium]
MRHRHQSDEREQELTLAISWVIAITAAHIGKQAYNDPGIHTLGTYLMGMAVSTPIGAFTWPRYGKLPLACTPFPAFSPFSYRHFASA